MNNKIFIKIHHNKMDVVSELGYSQSGRPILGFCGDNLANSLHISFDESWKDFTKYICFKPTGAPEQTDGGFVENTIDYFLPSSVMVKGSLIIQIEGRQSVENMSHIGHSVSIECEVLPSISAKNQTSAGTAIVGGDMFKTDYAKGLGKDNTNKIDHALSAESLDYPLTKSDVGLPNVDNITDAEKHVALADEATYAGHSGSADNSGYSLVSLDFDPNQGTIKEGINRALSPNIKHISNINYTLTATDDVILIDTLITNIIITLPVASTVLNKVFTIKRLSSGLHSASITTLDTDIERNASAIILNKWFQYITVKSIGTEWIVLGGNYNLSSVATTGSYNDLIDLPSIPTQYTDTMANAVITSQKNVANGVAGLDPNGDILVAQLPNNLISDTTYQSAWQSFTMTYDPATGIFTTSIAHPFAVNDPIEFQANGGTLPVGLLPYNSDNIGGTYYNVQSVSNSTHFTITDTIAGVLYKPTVAGIGAYQVRIAGVTSINITGLDLARDGMYKIEIANLGMAKKSTNGIDIIARLNSASYSYLSYTYPSSFFYPCAAFASKYSFSKLSIEMSFMSSDTVHINFRHQGVSSNTRASASILSSVGGVITKDVTANITSLLMWLADGGANAIIRNGTQVRVWRMN
jgi:hypothetical protein